MKILCLALLSVAACSLAGCGNHDQSKCQTNPTAQGCPRDSGNIVSSLPKSWSMDSATKRPNKAAPKQGG